MVAVATTAEKVAVTPMRRDMLRQAHKWKHAAVASGDVHRGDVTLLSAAKINSPAAHYFLAHFAAKRCVVGWWYTGGQKHERDHDLRHHRRHLT